MWLWFITDDDAKHQHNPRSKDSISSFFPLISWPMRDLNQNRRSIIESTMQKLWMSQRILFNNISKNYHTFIILFFSLHFHNLISVKNFLAFTYMWWNVWLSCRCFCFNVHYSHLYLLIFYIISLILVNTSCFCFTLMFFMYVPVVNDKFVNLGILCRLLF